MKKNWNIFLTIFMTWGALVLVALSAHSRILSAVVIFYTGVMPFICTVLFISKSIIAKKIGDYARKWHFAVYLSWVIFLYAIFAQQWASETLNNIFQVDAGSLSITYKLLAFLFAPFGIIYQAYILSWVWLLVIITGLAFFTILPLLLIFNVPLKIIWKKLVAFVIFFIFISFSVPMMSTITSNQNKLIIEFALWADFSSKNLCTDSWVSRTESVLFLGGDRVLAYHPHNLEGSKFSAETCNYTKTF